MIIRQTTTIVFEYPQDYLQEQEWRKTKEDRWIHKSTDTLGAIYENTISYSIGQPSNSEIPNNCEVKNYCDDCLYTDTCDSKEFFYACTSKATISKMEQVDEPIDRDDLGNCNICKYVGLEHRCNQCVNGSMFCKIEDEPQTDCPWK